MEAKQKVALTFALYQGETLLRRETVQQDIVKVGKDAKSHLRIDDEQASRMHAVIEVASVDDITLIDLGNEPGTLVNGARVNRCKVAPGDRIQIGGVSVVLEQAEPVAAEAAAPAAAPSASGANPFAAPAPAANPFGGGGGGGGSPFGGSADPFAAANPFAANPFSPFGQAEAGAPAAHVDEVPHDAPEGSYTYKMIPSGPAIASDEVETAATSIEVVIKWGQSTLHVAHLTPPRPFYVGEEEAKGVRSDYFIPAEKLGTTRAPVVLGDAVVLFPRATGWVEINGQRQTLDEVRPRAQPCSELSGAHQISLGANGKAHIELDNIVFEVSATNAGRVVAGHMAFDAATWLYQGLSLAVHAGLIAAVYMFMPTLDPTAEDGISDEQKYLIEQYLKAAAEKEQEEKETEQVADNAADNKEGGTGTRAKGEEGSMGNPNTKAQGMKYGVKGPADNPDPHIARQAALRDAAEFGMIGLLNSGMGGDPDAPTAPWGRDDSLGTDALSARGNMWGDSIGDSFGAGGLGLSGIGEGGGGRGEGIGLGSIGTLGHGAGTGTGQGFGSGSGRLGGSHRTKPPSVRMGGTSVSGRLPPEVIQRIVRQNFGRFRACYEGGLRNNPSLAGRVAVRFVIGRDGSVGSVGNGGSDLPDSGVVSCVVRAFYGLSFPQPEGGIVTVTYPIIFSPG